MVILVTGGGGFIGSAVVRRLIRSTNARVVNVDALTYAGHLESLEEVERDPRHVFVHADISDQDAMRAVFREHRPDAVIHLAAESHVDRSIDGPGAFIRTNLVGTYTLLEAARGHVEALPEDRRGRFRFLHVSTDEVFGALGDQGSFTEDSPYDPSSPYSASKAGADHLARAWHRTYGLPILMTHCGNNYGPFQFPEKLIPATIQRALSGEPIPVYGTGENVRDWIYVDDHVSALLRVLEAAPPGSSYAVGASGERTNLDVVRSICDVLDELRPLDRGRRYADAIRFVGDRPGHDWRYAIDASRIRAELGWAPRVAFPAGLRRTVTWYLDHPQWVELVRNEAGGREIEPAVAGAGRTTEAGSASAEGHDARPGPLPGPLRGSRATAGGRARRS